MEESKFVWMRMGDAADYVKFGCPFDAGAELGTFLSHCKANVLSFRRVAAGVKVTPYWEGRNYISLFWGDDDAQWIRDLTAGEYKEFLDGVEETLFR